MRRETFSRCRLIQLTLLEDGTYDVVIEFKEEEEAKTESVSEVKTEEEEAKTESVSKVKTEEEEAKTESVSKVKTLDDMFVLVEASKLSLNDNFMQYEPQTENEKEFKQLLSEVIQKGVKDFYRPRIDPSFAERNPKERDDFWRSQIDPVFEANNGIRYVAGNKPAVGMNYCWWKKLAEEYNPERNSRLGTRLEYGAFLGVLIKKLVEEGRTVEWAWNAVCNDSKELGHYQNSENAKRAFEPTGSRGVCGFYDLANTYKVLGEDEDDDDIWVASSDYHFGSDDQPIARFEVLYSDLIDLKFSVGWLVLEN